MCKVLRFAEERLNHTQPTKTVEVCLVQTKMNFDFTLPTSIYKYWCEENIIYNCVGCASNYSVNGEIVAVCRSTTEPSTTDKNRGSMFGTTKMNFDCNS